MQAVGIAPPDAERELIKIAIGRWDENHNQIKKNLNNRADNLEQTFENSKIHSL